MHGLRLLRLLCLLRGESHGGAPDAVFVKAAGIREKVSYEGPRDGHELAGAYQRAPCPTRDAQTVLTFQKYSLSRSPIVRISGERDRAIVISIRRA
jgi:hypothetical protein